MGFRNPIFLLLVLFLVVGGCSSPAGCPTCGTTVNGSYGIINIIPVPQHNPTGEPGGPFNSFDISLVDPVHHLFFVSDRIGLDVVVVDTTTNIAVNTIGGDNSVAQAGFNASPCDPSIPPLLDASGGTNFTRFGCRNPPFHIPGFGADGNFGGFPGAQCCAARANGVNPLSAPDGQAITADGNTLFVANGSSSVVVFDMTTKPIPTVIAVVPTGQSPTYDSGVAGIAPCIASANGRAFSDASCADLRADEMSWDEKDKILLVANGDPGFPFVTLIDMSHVVSRTGTVSQQHCLPVSPAAPYGPTNFPTCILGQIYYDGAPVNNGGVAVDDQTGAGFPCPDPSTPSPSGVSGTGVGAGGKNVPCHHGPIITSAGVFCNQLTPAANCAGATSPAGIGGSGFNPNTGHFLVTNANAAAIGPGVSPDLTTGTVDEIDPRIGNPNGPIVVNTFPVKNCMPSGAVQGPGNNFLITCENHDGVTFPPSEIVMDGGSGKILATITTVGGVDEAWFNPGDQRWYLAARDMPAGPVMGVIDSKTNTWLQNVTTNSNSHSIAADPLNNHIFVPMQSGGICTTQSSNGCIAVFARQ